MFTCIHSNNWSKLNIFKNMCKEQHPTIYTPLGPKVSALQKTNMSATMTEINCYDSRIFYMIARLIKFFLNNWKHLNLKSEIICLFLTILKPYLTEVLGYISLDQFILRHSTYLGILKVSTCKIGHKEVL